MKTSSQQTPWSKATYFAFAALVIIATFAASTGLTLLTSTTVRAHHTQVTFYFMDEVIEVTGVVKRWALVNPHPELVLEVTEEGGETTEFTVYALGAAGVMTRAGWTRDTLVPGETVTVRGSPSRGSGASMAGRSVTKASGTVLRMSGPDGPASNPAG
jgi:hypothetical protein